MTTRRQFLTGLGGITVALPLLEKLSREAWAQAATPSLKRVVVVTYQMGVATMAFKPSAAGSSFTLPFCSAPLTPFIPKSLFVTALDYQMMDLRTDHYWGHPAKSEAALTGTLTAAAFPTTNTNAMSEVIPYTEANAIPPGAAANGESIEQFIGTRIAGSFLRSSVDLGVDGDRQSIGVLPSRFFHEARASRVSMQANPKTAFDQTFTGVITSAPTPEQEAQQAALANLRARRKSVLDAVRDSYVELRQGLGTDDRRRLDDHLARVRQVELQVAPPPAGCSIPASPGTSFSGLHMGQLAPLQVQTLVNAMVCNVAPIGRLEFLNQQNPRFGVSSLDALLDSMQNNDWHGFVHGDPVPGQAGPTRLSAGAATDHAELLNGYRFFVQQYANVLAGLDAIPEGPSGFTALDNSLCIFATDLGEGAGHGAMKMSYVLSGYLGGAKKGFHYDGTPSMTSQNLQLYTPSNGEVSQLLNSVARIAGHDVSFGLQGYLGAKPRVITQLFA